MATVSSMAHGTWPSHDTLGRPPKKEFCFTAQSGIIRRIIAVYLIKGLREDVDGSSTVRAIAARPAAKWLVRVRAPPLEWALDVSNGSKTRLAYYVGSLAGPDVRGEQGGRSPAPRRSGGLIGLNRLVFALRAQLTRRRPYAVDQSDYADSDAAIAAARDSSEPMVGIIQRSA